MVWRDLGERRTAALYESGEDILRMRSGGVLIGWVLFLRWKVIL